MDIDGEILLAAGYAVFLLLTAARLEVAARHSHRRSELMRTTGFRYDPQLDLWHCPNNEKLLRVEVNYENRTVFYRAAAHACDRCSMKDVCTDSDQGRTIEHRPDSWVESKLRRFHRGISLALVVLAAFILAVEFVRYTGTTDRTVVGAMLLFLGVYGLRLASIMVRADRGTRP